MRAFPKLTSAPAAIPVRRLVMAGLLTGFLAGAFAMPGPVLASTPLPTPGTPVASEVTTTSVAFSWSPPAGPVASYTIQVIDGHVPWRDLATTTATSYTHTDLVPDTVYRYRIIAEPQPGSGYVESAPSEILWVRTEPLPDSVPPTAPGQPFATNVTIDRATVHFPASTDNNRVAGYWVQRQIDGAWTDWATNDIHTVYLSDLTPDTTYTVVVVAFDANGNRSPQSPPLTFTTRATEPEPTCQVTITDFLVGYILTVQIENMTDDTVVTDWSVTFTLPEVHAFSPFNSEIHRDGDQATLTRAPWFPPTIPPGGAAMVGGSGSYPAGSPLPSGFALQSNEGTYACT